MRALLNAVIVLSLLVTASSLGYLIFYRLTFNPSASFNRSTEGSAVKTLQNGSETGSGEEEAQEVPEEVLSQVENLSSVIISYFVKVRNGPSIYPALIFKTVPQKEGLKVYLLTYYPMEWPFVKVSLMGESLGAPQVVYQCPSGLLLLSYSVKGVFPVEVEKGEIGRYGALSTWTGKDFYVELFDSEKGCSNNGFVFNLSGDFSGVCFGGNFFRATELYDTIPESCKIIYQKEGENGDLQGENR